MTEGHEIHWNTPTNKLFFFINRRSARQNTFCVLISTVIMTKVTQFFKYYTLLIMLIIQKQSLKELHLADKKAFEPCVLKNGVTFSKGVKFMTKLEEEKIHKISSTGNQ